MNLAIFAGVVTAAHRPSRRRFGFSCGLVMSSVAVSVVSLRTMMPLPFPDGIVGKRSTMYAAFLECACAFGDSRSYATELLRLLPQPLKEAPVWFDKITSLWRYNWGKPYDNLPNDRVIIGTNDNPRVDILYLCVRIADHHLRPGKLLPYLERLDDQDKHADVVFEMRPAMNLTCSEGLVTDFEVSEFGPANKTCDWQFQCGDRPMLVEVKNRLSTFMQHMEHLIPQMDAGNTDLKPPAPDPAPLFRNVEEKFLPSDWLDRLQGVWIHTGIKEYRAAIDRFFNDNTDPGKVHFAILSGWNDSSYVMERNPDIKNQLLKFFGLTESNDLVSDEYR